MAGVARFASLRNVLLFFAVSTVLFVVGVSQGRGSIGYTFGAWLEALALVALGAASIAGGRSRQAAAKILLFLAGVVLILIGLLLFVNGLGSLLRG